MTTDNAQSIRQKLLNVKKERNEDFDFVLRQYALQRLLYRLSISEYAERFLLKGALLFWVWNAEFHRPTRDMDLLGFGNNDVDEIKNVFTNVISIACDDGLQFDASSLAAIVIKEDAQYQGIRVTGYTYLTNAKIPFQIDIGFGDAVEISAQRVTIPSFLAQLPAAQMRVYPVYSVIAEKFQSMIYLGTANSRMKDFFDIYTIALTMSLEKTALMAAITATFACRQTTLNNEPLFVFSDAFINDESKAKQWNAFINKNRLPCVLCFSEVMDKLQLFLQPVHDAIQNDEPAAMTWNSVRWQWE